MIWRVFSVSAVYSRATITTICMCAAAKHALLLLLCHGSFKMPQVGRSSRTARTPAS